MEGIFDVGGLIFDAKEPLLVGFVVGKKQPIAPFGKKIIISQSWMVHLYRVDAVRSSQLAQLGLAHDIAHRSVGVAPLPRIAIRKGGQEVERRRIRPTVGYADPDQDVILVSFGIFDQHIEVAIFGKDPRIHQFVLKVLKAAAAIFRHQIAVWESRLWVFVEHLHITVGRRAVQVKIDLLDILAVVAFGAGQPKEAFLENWIVPIPEGQRKTEILVAVRDPCEAILIPAVDTAARVIMGEVIPGRAVFTVILAHSSPRARAKIGSSMLPVCCARPVFSKALVFGCLCRHEMIAFGDWLIGHCFQ